MLRPRVASRRARRRIAGTTRAAFRRLSAATDPTAGFVSFAAGGTFWRRRRCSFLRTGLKRARSLSNRRGGIRIGPRKPSAREPRRFSAEFAKRARAARPPTLYRVSCVADSPQVSRAPSRQATADKRFTDDSDSFHPQREPWLDQRLRPLSGARRARRARANNSADHRGRQEDHHSGGCPRPRPRARAKAEAGPRADRASAASPERAADPAEGARRSSVELESLHREGGHGPHLRAAAGSAGNRARPRHRPAQRRRQGGAIFSARLRARSWLRHWPDARRHAHQPDVARP